MTKFKLSFRSDRMERGREVTKQFGGDPDAVRRHATASAAVWVEVPDDRADELTEALDTGQIAGLACFRRMGAMPRVEFRAPRHVREWLGGQPVARIEWAMGELLRLEARVARLTDGLRDVESCCLEDDCICTDPPALDEDGCSEPEDHASYCWRYIGNLCREYLGDQPRAESPDPGKEGESDED